SGFVRWMRRSAPTTSKGLTTGSREGYPPRCTRRGRSRRSPWVGIGSAAGRFAPRSYASPHPGGHLTVQVHPRENPSPNVTTGNQDVTVTVGEQCPGTKAPDRLSRYQLPSLSSPTGPRRFSACLVWAGFGARGWTQWRRGGIGGQRGDRDGGGWHSVPCILGMGLL
ncbi:MAG: hypothetical protein RLZ45_802, partial [Verrucomicrobiota bacterium]